MRTILLGLCLFVLASCDSGFDTLNVNPTQAAEVEPGFLFTKIQLDTSGGRYENWRANLIYSATMVQHMAALPTYWSGDKYLYNAGYSSSMFDRYYPTAVKGVQDLLSSLADGGDPGQIAQARIMRVFMFSRLTDLHGDIPYSEAGKGVLDGVFLPKYDTQQSIYADMLNELEQASTQVVGGTGFGAADVMFGGDTAKWQRWANSLMLRLGMRMSKVDPAGAQSWVQKAIAGGVMMSNDDVAYVPHTDGPGGINKNGNGEVFTADGNPRLSHTFVDWMFTRGDPRLRVYGALPSGDTDPANQKGLPNGFDTSTIADYPGGADITTYTEPNRAVVTGEDDPMFFQTYAEVEFLLAEASVLGWHSGDAATHYDNGVRAAMQYLTMYGAGGEIADAEIDAYLAANPFDAATGLQQIGEQYWAATFLNHIESWSNWRRTGYPELTPNSYPGNVTGGTIPRRLRYPGNEAIQNAANYSAAVSQMGADELTTRVWWDVP